MAKDFHDQLQKAQAERDAANASALEATQKAEWYKGLCWHAINEPAGSPLEFLFEPADVEMLHAFLDEAQRVSYRNASVYKLGDRFPQPRSGSSVLSGRVEDMLLLKLTGLKICRLL